VKNPVYVVGGILIALTLGVIAYLLYTRQVTTTKSTNPAGVDQIVGGVEGLFEGIVAAVEGKKK